MLTVINGPMYSGKTSTLICLANKHLIAGNKVVCFKPAMDGRYHKTDFATHDGKTFPAFSISTRQLDVSVDAWLTKEGIKDFDIICFDEAQFFDEESILDIVNFTLFDLKKKVIVAGLSQDIFGNPFGAMPTLLAIADKIINLSAVCTKCKSIGDATRTYRKGDSKEQVVVGGLELYSAMCFKCWSGQDKPKDVGGDITIEEVDKLGLTPSHRTIYTCENCGVQYADKACRSHATCSYCGQYICDTCQQLGECCPESLEEMKNWE